MEQELDLGWIWAGLATFVFMGKNFFKNILDG